LQTSCEGSLEEGLMANERLRKAVSAARVGVDAIASATGVDPKTVQRWIGGRVPHARHRWTVAKLLQEREDYLWPEDTSASGTVSKTQTAEILAAYGHRSDVPSSAWWALFTKATGQIDLLGYAIHFLPEQLPGLAALLQEKSQHGCQVRIALGDPDSV